MRPLLALFIRALRENTRARSTYILRAGIAVLILLFLWVAHEGFSWMGAAGRRFFSVLVVGNYLFVTLLGLGSFASAIAEEKEEGTLGLIRMADISPLALLFGKSTSRLGTVMLLLLVQIPFTFLAVTLGGVSLTQILAALGLLATYMFALANVSLFFSVLLPRSGRAALMTIGAIVGYCSSCIAPYLLSEWLVNKGRYSATDPTIESLKAAGDWLWSVNPANHCAILASGGYLSIEIMRSVAVHLGVGVAFFAFALLIFERCCDNEAIYSSNSGGRLHRWRWLGRPSRPREHAIAWKDFHFAMGGRFSVALRFVGYSLAIVVLAWANDDLGQPRTIANYSWVWGWTVFYIELVFLALFMWGPEAWGRHIGSLIAIPRSLRRLNFEKLKAMLMATLPSVAIVTLGLIIGGSEFIDQTILGSFNASNSGPGGMPFRYWRIISLLQWAAQFGVLLSLIVNLSLRLKWTALPAALGLFVLYQVIHTFASIASLYLGGRRTMPASFEPMLILGISLMLIFFLIRNTRSLLLRHATEG
jgi:hypothetical protein